MSNQRSSQSSTQQPIVNAAAERNETDDAKNCVVLYEGKKVIVSDKEQRDTRSMCVDMPGSSKENMLIRVQTSAPGDSQLPNRSLSHEERMEIFDMKLEVMVCKSESPIDDKDHCEDGERFELFRDGTVPLPAHSLPFHIRNISGGRRLYINVKDSRAELGSVTALSAIEDAGSDKMDEFRKMELCFLFGDIPNSKKGPGEFDPNYWLPVRYQGHGIPERKVDLSQWLGESFGSSHDSFMVTQEYFDKDRLRNATISRSEAFEPVGRFQGADVQDFFIVDEEDPVRSIPWAGNPIICVAKEGNFGADSDTIAQHPIVIGAGIVFVAGVFANAIIKMMRPKVRTD